jgi:transcriptional regulator with XRE-family HTH domain
MVTENEQLRFENALCERVVKLRKAKGWTAEEMALALGIPADRYRKYETRSPLPQYLIPRFAKIVDRSIEYILTGKERRKRETPSDEANVPPKPVRPKNSVGQIEA